MITVIGSYAIGVTIKTERFPVAGETVFGHSFALLHGGKGSNQAVGCARMGAKVFFYTCLGKDTFGENAIKLYEQEGIDVSGTKYSDSKATAAGLVTVNGEGENQIVMDYGACNDIGLEDIDNLLPQIRESSLVVMQLELGIEAVAYAAELCKREGVKVLLNPAPFKEMPEGMLLNCCEYLTPNETEARLLLGLAPDDATSNGDIAKMLLALGVRNVVMTMGGDGAMIANAGGCVHIKGSNVDAVDTTGAGDTFTAALAVALSEGVTLQEAVRFANAAGALSVTKYGVVEALPYRKDVDAFLK